MSFDSLFAVSFGTLPLAHTCARAHTHTVHTHTEHAHTHCGRTPDALPCVPCLQTAWRPDKLKEMTYTQFLTLVKEGRVDKVRGVYVSVAQCVAHSVCCTGEAWDARSLSPASGLRSPAHLHICSSLCCVACLLYSLAVV